MWGKYFNVTLRPTITASKQHAGAFAAGDVLLIGPQCKFQKDQLDYYLQQQQ